MKAFAGPAMLLVMVGGYLIHRGCSDEKSPPRSFTEAEFAGAGAQNGSCYALSTVLIANGVFGNVPRTWTSPRDQVWTLALEKVADRGSGPVRLFQNYTFERVGDQVKLAGVEASEGFPTDLQANIDDLLVAPNMRRSTPVDRCANGGTGYRFTPRR